MKYISMKKCLSVGIILLFVISSFTGLSNQIEQSSVDTNESETPYEISTTDGPMDSAWPMHCHDLHHTSQSPYSTASNPGLEKWRFIGDGITAHVNGGIIIGDDGTLYFGDSSYDFYALHPNGSLKWKYRTGGAISHSTPAIAEDGTLYIGAWDHYLHAVYSTNGTRKWIFHTNANIDSAPTIAQDGTIYVATLWTGGDGGKVHAVNPDGTEKWRFQTGDAVSSSPAISDDGTIFFGSYDTYVYALNPNGTLKWKYKTGDQVRGSPSIADDGTIYIGSWDGNLYALNPNGTMKWKSGVGHDGTATNPSIGSDGTIYVGGAYLYAIYPNGTRKWSFNMGPGRKIFMSFPAISADGTIYVGTHVYDVSAGEIIAVNPDGTERWRKLIVSGGWVDSSPSIGEDGTVYIGSFNSGRGYLHAFGPIESNEKPNPPIITGDVFGFPGRYSIFWFKVYDPDKNPIKLYVDWGDGTFLDWTAEYASGENIYKTHTWERHGNYTIKAKVKDVLGEESDWSTFNYEAGGTNLYLAFLRGEIYDYHYDSPRDEINFKTKNLLIISLYPPLIKRYTSGEPIIIDDILIAFTRESHFWSGIVFKVYLLDEQNHIDSEIYEKPRLAERVPNAFSLLRYMIGFTQ